MRIQYWLVMNGQTDTTTANTALALRHAVNISCHAVVYNNMQVCDEPLHSVRAHDQGILLATGSHSGATTLLELSSSLYSLQRNEKSIITAVRSNAYAAWHRKPGH